MIPGLRDSQGRIYATTDAVLPDAPFWRGVAVSPESMIHIDVGTDPSLTLNLDFLNSGPLDSRVTFTRTTVATYLNEAGLLATAAIDAPRFEYDANGNPLGLLIEGARTNEIVHSNDFNASGNGWFANNGAVVTPNVGISPDGTVNASRFTAVDPELLLYFDNSGVTGTKSFSFFAKADVGSTISLGGSIGGLFPDIIIDLEDGSVTAPGTGNFKTTIFPNGWWKISGQLSVGFASGNADFITIRAPDGACLIYGSQLEVGSSAACASSYIPTTDVPVTRAADNVSMTGTNFSSWYDQAQGTWAAQFDLVSRPVSDLRILADVSPVLPLLAKSNYVTSAYFGWANGPVGIQDTNMLDSVIKSATRYSPTETTVATNGGLGVPVVGTIESTMTRLWIGGEGEGLLFGHMQRLAYWSRELTDAEMIDVTGGGVGTHIYPTTNEGALQIEVDGIPHSYNGGVGYTIDERVCARLNATPDPNDGYVAGVRVTPEGLVHFVTNTPPPVSDGFSTGFSNGYGA